MNDTSKMLYLSQSLYRCKWKFVIYAKKRIKSSLVFPLKKFQFQERKTKFSSVSFFVSNLRFKVWHFLKPINANDKKETYGFRTTQTVPSVAEIKNLENALYDLVKNVKLKQIAETTLQSTLINNIGRLNESNNIFVAADKTNSYHEIFKNDHDELIEKNVTKEYKKCTKKKLVENVNKVKKK